MMAKLKRWAWIACTWRPENPETENTIIAGVIIVASFVALIVWL